MFLQQTKPNHEKLHWKLSQQIIWRVKQNKKQKSKKKKKNNEAQTFHTVKERFHLICFFFQFFPFPPFPFFPPFPPQQSNHLKIEKTKYCSMYRYCKTANKLRSQSIAGDRQFNKFQMLLWLQLLLQLLVWLQNFDIQNWGSVYHSNKPQLHHTASVNQHHWEALDANSRNFFTPSTLYFSIQLSICCFPPTKSRC